MQLFEDLFVLDVVDLSEWFDEFGTLDFVAVFELVVLLLQSAIVLNCIARLLLT